jgi:hypothetical protein
LIIQLGGKPDSVVYQSDVYDAQQKLLIHEFFVTHPGLSKEMCHNYVLNVVETELAVQQADTQFAACYTCRIDTDNDQPTRLFQFLDNNLDKSELDEAGKVFGDMVPMFQYLGTFHSLFVWAFECPARLPFGSVVNKLSRDNNFKHYKDIN